MKTLLLAMLGLAATTGPARGAAAPLLVSVEVAPGVDIGAADVRHAVAAELGTAVVGARESTADGASNVLLVALDAREIRMSLRAGNGPIVSRAIAVPPDRSGRLRSIGWLAGNLVRDQVSPIVAIGEAPPTPPVAPPAATEPPLLAASGPPAASPAPAAVLASAPVSSAPAAVVASPPAIPADAFAHTIWSITASGGPVVTVIHDSTTGDTSATRSGVFELEVQRQRMPDGMLFGVALTFGPNAPRHYVGAAAFAGEAWRGRSWFAEATLGLGVEALDGFATTGTTIGTATDPPMVISMSEGTTSVGPMPGLYLRAAGVGGLRLSRAFDLVAQLGAHLSSSGDVGSYLGATTGVRLRLP